MSNNKTTRPSALTETRGCYQFAGPASAEINQPAILWSAAADDLKAKFLLRHQKRNPNSTNPNPKVRKSGAVAKAVLVSMVLEEEGPIRAAQGEGSRDTRRANNHPAKGPAPPGSIIFSVPVGFMVQKKEQRKK